MKNIYAVVLAFVVTLALVGVVSADQTIVVGTIYDAANTDVVYPDAEVVVHCGELEQTVYSGDGTNGQYGAYVAKFNYAECAEDSLVWANATLGSMTGSSKKVSVQQLADGVWLNLGLADADVFLIPEFSLIIGGLTIAGALVAFMIIRRK